jgi:hypothetical protein
MVVEGLGTAMLMVGMLLAYPVLLLVYGVALLGNPGVHRMALLFGTPLLLLMGLVNTVAMLTRIQQSHNDTSNPCPPQRTTPRRSGRRSIYLNRVYL